MVLVVIVSCSGRSGVVERISWFPVVIFGDHCGKVLLVEVASSPGTEVLRSPGTTVLGTSE